jgi:hypothetical protein
MVIIVSVWYGDQLCPYLAVMIDNVVKKYRA